MTARRPAFRLAALIVLLAVPAAAQELSLSVAAGGLVPLSGDYRETYGPGLSVEADLWLRLRGRLGLAAGFSSLSDKGLARPSGDEEAVYPLRFRRASIPVVLFYEIKAGIARLRLGAGASFHSFRETWRTVDLDYRASKISPHLVAAASIGLFGRLSLFGSAAYDPIRAGADSPLGLTVDVGGIQILGGIAWRIF